MINLKVKKNPMPEQAPDIRNHNFEEVSEGYTPQMAINEAMRCLNCREKPCTHGCPVMVRIPEFIAKITEGDFEGAYQVISATSSLPRVCGRVCPQENQCEKYCVRGKKGEPVGIGRLERFVADWHAAHAEELEADAAKDETENSEAAELPAGSKVAVVGAGPAGLACAGDLAAKGYDVTVFESLHKPGGVLAYGIPEFRLPKSIVAAEVEKLEKRGVTFVTIPGENLLGVCSANEYLTRINLMKGYLPEYDTPVQKAKNIAVVGGGNVAMDAARCAKRMGAENVYIVYRRSMEEIPARSEEIHHAIEEGIDFQLLRNPVKVIGDENGYVTGLECVKMELGEPDASGRRRPVAIEGSNFVLDVDCVIMAIGTKLNKLIVETTDKLEPNERGGIGTDEGAATSREGVFAGGDAVTGAATVILAMGAGKTAAASIDQYLSEK